MRLRDAGECMERCVTFMPFNVLEGFDDLPRKSERLKEIRPLGFTPCKYLVTKRPLTQAETEDGIKQLQQYAKDSDIPIDGIVVTYNDIAFSKRCGRTGLTIRTVWRSNLRTSCLRQHFVPSSGRRDGLVRLRL